jgi:hypothetical protein
MPSQALTAKGVTTEVAEPIVFLLGAMVMFDDQELAIGLGVLPCARQAARRRHGSDPDLGPRCGVLALSLHLSVPRH